MNELVQQVMMNAMIRHVEALKRGKRLARQARAIQEEPEGTKHTKDPWNDVHAYKHMRLHLCDSARETLRMLKSGKL